MKSRMTSRSKDQKVTLKEIECYFKDYDYKNNTLILDKCTTITDLKKYVETQIRLLKGRIRTKSFKPYADRLKRVYLKTKENDE
jgi:hypothetical protein